MALKARILTTDMLTGWQEMRLNETHIVPPSQIFLAWEMLLVLLLALLFQELVLQILSRAEHRAFQHF
jgi:hypothetical protein